MMTILEPGTEVIQLSWITVLKPGTEVTLLGGIKAVIAGVMLEDAGRVSYRAIWPNGANLEEKWIPEMAIENKPEGHTVNLGFGARLQK